MSPLLKSIRWGLTTVALVLLLSMVVLGCDNIATNDGGAVTTAGPVTTGVLGDTLPTGVPVSSTDTSTPVSTGPTASTPTTEALSSAEEMLPDGNIRAMGFIDSVWEDGDGRHLSIDYAEMLMGAEADAAAVAAGEIAPGEHVPNDYFITNVNPMLREFDISDSVVITTSTRWAPHDGMGAPCSWDDFKQFWGIGPLVPGDEQMPYVPWWIVRDGNTIISIDEQYLP